MILEIRTSIAHAAKAHIWLEYEERLLPIQQKTLGNLVGVFTSEVGTLNQIVHIWSYDTPDERDKRRAALHQHPEWKALQREAPQGVLAQQKTELFYPASFSPMR